MTRERVLFLLPPQVLNNPQLTTTAGLLSLEDVGLHAHFIWNTNLRDIDGLSNIKSVKGDVVIVASPITDLSPLTVRAFALC